MARCSFYPKQWLLEVSTGLVSNFLDTYPRAKSSLVVTELKVTGLCLASRQTLVSRD